MKISTSLKVAVILSLAVCVRLEADVFSLFPFRSGSLSGADQALSGTELWTEAIEINGRRLDLQVALVNKTMEQALRDLRGQYKKGAAAINSNSLLFEIPLASGARKRYYLVELKGMIPMLQFSLVLPAGFSRNKYGAWPSELPLPSGAQSRTVMRLPKRDSVYGLFESPFPAQQSLADLSRNLEGNGWKSMGRESRSSMHASGEVFLRNDGRKIMVISVQNAPSGSGSTGSIYLRALSDK